MKKLFVFILAVVYLTSSIGATVHLHYCMSKLISWSLNAEGSKCKNCGMEKDGGCCKDEQKLVKNTSDQKTVETIQLSQFVAIHSPVSFINVSEYCFSSRIEKNFINHSPPIKSGVDILIQNSVFRI